MADGFALKVDGLGAVGEQVAQQVANVAARARVAMVAEAAGIAADAVNRCPYDDSEAGAKRHAKDGTPHLRETVFIAPTPDGAAVGFSAPHAVYVHERLDVRHKSGEAKFLEHAKDAAAGQVAQRVAERAKVGG